MSRYCSTTNHQFTSIEMTSSGSQDPNGGHCASPYLRRIRIPKLNTFRHHLEEDEDDEEWFEMQMAKKDLIRLRMNEMKMNHLKDRANNNNNNNHSKIDPNSLNSSSTANQTVKKQNTQRTVDDVDVESRNGNRCLRPVAMIAAAEKTKSCDDEILETQTAMRRCLWFHPKHLFNIGPEPKKTNSSEIC